MVTNQPQTRREEQPLKEEKISLKTVMEYGALIARNLATREKCWKLHGKPRSHEWGQKGDQPRNNGQVHNAAASQEQSRLNQEEIKRVRSLINSL